MLSPFPSIRPHGGRTPWEAAAVVVALAAAAVAATVGGHLAVSVHRVNAAAGSVAALQARGRPGAGCTGAARDLEVRRDCHPYGPQCTTTWKLAAQAAASK